MNTLEAPAVENALDVAFLGALLPALPALPAERAAEATRVDCATAAPRCAHAEPKVRRLGEVGMGGVSDEART